MSEQVAVVRLAMSFARYQRSRSIKLRAANQLFREMHAVVEQIYGIANHERVLIQEFE